MSKFWVDGAVGLAAAGAVGTFVEYAVHRLMHYGQMLGKHHAEHHQDGWGQGWLGEFREYAVGSIPVIAVGGLVGWLALGSPVGGAAFVLGAIAYAAFAAYAHQVQHECPEMVFWMPRPVHYLHHKHKMWHHNFGISFDFWDRVFGTYRRCEWEPDRRPRDFPVSRYLQINWLNGSPPLEEQPLAARRRAKADGSLAVHGDEWSTATEATGYDSPAADQSESAVAPNTASQR